MSAPVIKLRTISGNPETAAQLSGGSFARQISLPVGWSKVRVGIRLHLTSTGAALTGSNSVAIGLCSGLTNTFGDVTTTHWAGFYSDDINFFNTNRYAWATYPSKKVGTTITKGTRSNDVRIGAGAASATADIALFFVDITKGSPNYTFNLFIHTTDGAPANTTNADFLSFMQQATPSLSEYTYTSNVTLAVDEATDGVFDSINIFWSTTQIAMEVCDVGLVRLS